MMIRYYYHHHPSSVAAVVVDGTVILVKKAEVVEDAVEIEMEDTGKSTKLCN